MAHWLDLVGRRLEQMVPSSDGTAHNPVRLAMREGLLGQGKRVRPLLLLVTASCLRLDPVKLLDAACALEMVHTASLFLDDLPCMDDAMERRGQPALHIRFGEDVALLASVALLSESFRAIAASPSMTPLLRTQAITALASAVGPQGLVQGQYRDLHDQETASPERDIARTNALKTGSLFKAALDIAAAAANAPASTASKLSALAGELGQAFQLRDDLQDGVPLALGHSEDEGKLTLVKLIGADGTRRQFDQCMDRAADRLAEIFPHDNRLANLVQQVMGPTGGTPLKLPGPRFVQKRAAAFNP